MSHQARNEELSWALATLFKGQGSEQAAAFTLVREFLLGLARSLRPSLRDDQVEYVVDELLEKAIFTDKFCNVEHPRTYLRRQLNWRFTDLVRGESREREAIERIAAETDGPDSGIDSELPEASDEHDDQVVEELRWFRQKVIAPIAATEKRREAREGLPKHVDGLIRIKRGKTTIQGRAEELLAERGDDSTEENLRKARTRLQKEDQRARDRVKKGVARLRDLGELTREDEKRATRIAAGLLRFRKGRTPR